MTRELDHTKLQKIKYIKRQVLPGLEVVKENLNFNLPENDFTQFCNDFFNNAVKKTKFADNLQQLLKTLDQLVDKLENCIVNTFSDKGSHINQITDELSLIKKILLESINNYLNSDNYAQPLFKLFQTFNKYYSLLIASVNTIERSLITYVIDLEGLNQEVDLEKYLKKLLDDINNLIAYVPEDTHKLTNVKEHLKGSQENIEFTTSELTSNDPNLHTTNLIEENTFTLPMEVLNKIIYYQVKNSFFNNDTFQELKFLVSKNWNEAYKDIHLWKTLCMELVGTLPPVAEEALDYITCAQWLKFCSDHNPPFKLRESVSWYNLLFLVEYKKNQEVQKLFSDETLIQTLGLTPLHISVILESTDDIDLYLSKTNFATLNYLNMFDRMHFSPLMWAAVTQNYEIFKKLFI